MRAAYRHAITKRRAFRLPGYKTLADAEMEGDWVSPIQMTSGNPDGPMFISKDWLDYPSAIANHTQLRKTGYLPDNPFNKVMDKVLARANLTRADIYITPVFHLLTARRSSTIPPADARASFEAVVRHELMGRRPIALGTDAARVLHHFGIAHIKTLHPSARTGSFDQKADQISEALLAA
ncbi:hypothetical protein [Yoonia sp. R2-816]|uniref:hypothetical protein n=1 Tax=Yoonia sp. R2-816 TaxID=3342638 RepID=UPI0037273AEE